jgi:ABC-type lipoprotein release transport system permease subunit
MVRQADVADSSLSALDSSIGSKIAAMPDVAFVSGMMFTAVVIPEAGSFFIIQGYGPKEFAIQRYKISSGETLKNNRQIIIGKMAASALKKKVGDTLELSGSRFKVVGIYETGIGWEETGGVITLRDAQTLMGRPRKVTMYAIKVKDPARAAAVVERINTENPDAHAALSGEFVDQMPDMQNSNAMMFAITALAVVVGGLGVMNTMLMSVLERTREIGVLRALGWRRKAVLGMILREALLLGILGGLVGVIFALLLAGLLGLIPGVKEYLDPLWSLPVFTRALTTALALGMVGGIYPAYRATRLLPVEALRYE